MVDVSYDAQLASIDSPFAAARASHELGVLQHPAKPRLRAIPTFKVLPDADMWANAGPRCVLSSHAPSVILYAYFWGQLDDSRLDCAVMRPMESDGDHFLMYYLTWDDATEQFKDSCADPRGVDAPQEEEDVRFLYIAIFFSLSHQEFRQPNSTFVRDYEVVKVEQEVPSFSSLTTRAWRRRRW